MSIPDFIPFAKVATGIRNPPIQGVTVRYFAGDKPHGEVAAAVIFPFLNNNESGNMTVTTLLPCPLIICAFTGTVQL